MMRLSRTRDPARPGRPVWLVEGRIASEYALLLRDEYEALPPEARRALRIDLGRVSFVDEHGAALLCRMEDERVVLAGANPFVCQILAESRRRSRRRF